MDLEKSKNDYYWKLLNFTIQEKRIVRVFDIFRQYKIEPVLIKGWAAARNYPKPFDRLSVDIDIAVNPFEFEICEKILKENQNLGVDLHKGLRHLDTFEWDYLFAATELVKINQTDVRILCAEDHLRVMCVHWLTDGGVNKEKLWDIYYAVENRPEDFRWDRFLSKSNLRRRKWLICAIGLAEKYLGLDISETPIEKETKNLPDWIIKTVENEWKKTVKLKPLENCIYNKKEFWEQIKIRFYSNPIQATVNMEGDFDDRSRLSYQIASNFSRIKPSLKRIFRILSEDLKRKWQK